MKLEKKDLPVVAGFKTDLAGLIGEGEVHLVVHSNTDGVIDLMIPPGMQQFLAVATARAMDGCALVIPDEDLMKPARAAEFLGVSRPMIYKWIDQGLLEDRRVGADHRVTAASVEKLAEDRRGADEAAARLVRDHPDSPSVVAARARVQARRAARG